MTIPTKAAFQEVLGSDFVIPFEDGSQMVLRLDEVTAREHLDKDDVEHEEAVDLPATQQRQ